MTSNSEAGQPAAAPTLETMTANVQEALLAYRKAKGTGWKRESETTRRLMKSLARMINSQIGSDLEARVVLYPVTQKDKDDEAKLALQEQEEKATKAA